MERLYAELKKVLRGRVRRSEPMWRHTSWRIGGPADILVEPASVADVEHTMQMAAARAVPVTVIGAGTNVLVLDGGIRGVVLKIGYGMAALEINGLRITCGAGLKLGRLAHAACAAGISGLEFACGIPGSVGGAVVMNAGAAGGQMSQVVEWVRVFQPGEGLKVLAGGELGFAYRYSALQQSRAVVLEVGLGGRPGDSESIRQQMQQNLAGRLAQQPLEWPNAGSVFKNPPGRAAGQLIEAAGLKGYTIGGAQISSRHANFIINLGQARAADVLALIELARAEVKRKFDVELVCEVRILGEA
ncbi:UDP-N-acetylmuramate dehydrogenase [Desulfurispora thermophila]|uniref:UDP-N-acetylmuramate dehydrogenase n=1 Tax=Desulfurispora thermophila TaxID=265470 RepID=UPI000382BC42|nr:UDP-N-acetylmuramate dehydrogenase [Desulfurispora thermophila]